MKNASLLFVFLIPGTLSAQFYYKDIVATRDVNARINHYKQSKVESVTATGFDPQGRKTADFNEWQEFQPNNSMLKITTRNGQTVTRLYYRFDELGRVTNLRDSSGDIQIITDFTYDSKGNLVRLLTTRKDVQLEFNETEDHKWEYTPDGRPERMWKIMNNSDTLEYRFTADEQGNVADETMFRKGRGSNPVYYYYEDQRIYYYHDEQKRLTDIVRYNKKARELLPDVMFEYDDRNNVIQRLTTLSTTSPDYLIWRYIFNEKNLKTKEALFDKDKALKGRIDYAYSFSQ